jgi:hypothetical protein
MNRRSFVEKRFQLWRFDCVNVLCELGWKDAIPFQVKNVNVAGMFHRDEHGGAWREHVFHWIIFMRKQFITIVAVYSGCFAYFK